jgi:hypothetical protein
MKAEWLRRYPDWRQAEGDVGRSSQRVTEISNAEVWLEMTESEQQEPS